LQLIQYRFIFLLYDLICIILVWCSHKWTSLPSRSSRTWSLPRFLW
jgi:hypothetical protein